MLKQRRTAFTLIELLVVISIIAILSALGAWGLFAMRGAQHKRNTDTTVRTVHKMLLTRWASVIADAGKEPPSAAAFLLASGDPERAKIIWIKVRLHEAFPMTYAEIQPSPASGPLTVVDTYIPANMRKPYFVKYQTIVGAAPGGAPGESAACLLMALQNIGAGDVALDDQIKHAIAPNDNPKAKTGPTNTIPCLIDSWGHELGFFRWAWNDTNLQASVPDKNAKFADPIDNMGKLITPGWYSAPATLPALNARQTFELQFHKVAPTSVGAPAKALYVIPVVASAGRDHLMQLNADLSSAGAGSADNIFSFQLSGN